MFADGGLLPNHGESVDRVQKCPGRGQRVCPTWSAGCWRKDTAALAERLLAQAIVKQGVDRDQLTIHSDRGTSMASKGVALLLADLGVTKSFSRPHCRTITPTRRRGSRPLGFKYRPDFPARFGSQEDGRGFCSRFFAWYNDLHRHSGIAYYTPADVHYGRARLRREQRAAVLTVAYHARPERFVRQPPEPPGLPLAAWINRPAVEVMPAR